MIMKNQLLNLKMIALMCLMMVLGGANVWAADKITDVANIVSGGKYYIGATTSNGDDWYLKIDGTSIASGIKGVPTKYISEGAIFIIEKNGNSWNLKFDGTSNYLALGSSNSKLDVVSTATAFTFANKKGLIYMTSKVGNTDRALKRNGVASNLFFGSYKTGYTDGCDVWLMPATPAKTLTSLAISGEPSKKTYEVGKALDPTGLVVTGTYDDNTTAPITDGITWTMNPATLSLSDVACSVTATVGGVTSPAYNVTGLTVNEAKVPSVIFYESFDKNDGTGGNDGLWSNDIAKNTLKLDNTEWTCVYGYGAQKCAKFGGSSNKKGVATTPSIDLSAGDAVLAFKAGAWNTKSEKTSIIVSVDNGKLAYNGKVASEQTITLKKGEFSDYTMTISGGTSATKITFSAIQESDNRFFLDEVMVSKAAAAKPTYTKQTPVTFRAKDNGIYYATFSNDKVTFIPYDLCEPYTIVVSNGNIEKSVIKQESADINGKAVEGYFIPANTGVLLYSLAETADYYTVENKTVDALAEKTNMLMPAPVAGGEFTAKTGYKYYKLAYNNYDAKTGLGFYWGADNGGAFKVKAGTAYLAVPAGDAPAKGFAFNGEATGIEGVNANVENAKAIYNLNGQRVASMAKPGLYIVNGKKVVRK